MPHLSHIAKNGHIAAAVKNGYRGETSYNANFDASVYGSAWSAAESPRYEMPEGEMPARVAYRLIHDQLALDTAPALNLASFVTTYVEDEAEKLMMESITKNFIDYEEYPETCNIHSSCVSMIGRLFNAPTAGTEEPFGVSTVGSSEAIILSTLAMKKRWKEHRVKQGLSTDKPNIVMCSNVQVCWEKAARYLEIEENYVYCTNDRFALAPEDVAAVVDENTIGVAVILGTTYTGHYEDVKGVHEALKPIAEKLKRTIPIHVDAASGGFVAPFINPELEWDFRVPSVVSINVSGHKYGLVAPGVGWCIFRDPHFLPKDLVFNINYLGADQASFTLNFSKGASQVIAQYYQLIRLGKTGYKNIMTNLMSTTEYLANALEETGLFTILSPRNGAGLPLVAMSLKGENNFDEFDIAHGLREHQWVVPAYTGPPTDPKRKYDKPSKMMRIVIREDFTLSRATLLVRDFKSVLEHLKKTHPDVLADKKKYKASMTREKMELGDIVNLFRDQHSLQAKHGKSHPVC